MKKLMIALHLMTGATPAVAAQEDIYAKGTAWLARMDNVIPAKCLIEIAKSTGEEGLLTSAKWRGIVEEKAVELAGAYSNYVDAADGLFAIYTKVEGQQRDLLDNKLITDAEYNAALGVSRGNMVRAVERLKEAIGLFPSCKFLKGYRFEASVSVRAARDALGKGVQ